MIEREKESESERERYVHVLKEFHRQTIKKKRVKTTKHTETHTYMLKSEHKQTNNQKVKQHFKTEKSEPTYTVSRTN